MTGDGSDQRRDPAAPSEQAGRAPHERTPVEHHLAHVDRMLAPLLYRAPEEVAIGEALGRVTAREIVSPIALPPFRNAQMDGLAVRAADVAGASAEHPVVLPVVGRVAAAPGEPPTLGVGQAIRIMTGAPMPAGADAVVPVEDTAPGQAGAGGAVLRPRVAGEYVREAGSDLAAGARLLAPGIRLASRHLAALAAAGLATVPVRRRPRVAVVSTGSELVEPGAALGPGRIPDSNGVAIAAASRAVGAETVAVDRVTDDAAELATALDAAVAAGAELILTTGGVSQGEHEVVRDLLEPLGARVDSLALQPGGPQATAHWGATPVICFPGNPVSSQLSFALFVAPTLRGIAGIPEPAREARTLVDAVRSAPGRRQLLRGRRLDGGRVATVAGPGSHLVAALAASDVIIDVPAAVTELAAGDTVETWEL